GKEWAGGAPQCGPLYMHLYVWDRRADLLSKSGVSREDLDAQCGVSLFRDGLRVLPYGEQGDDWLQLDRDRINDPSRRIGNNQVIGYVEVDQMQNPELRDKTNREGLIDNAAFQDMRTLVRSVMAKFTNLWIQDRPNAEGAQLPRRRAPANFVTAAEVRHIVAALENAASDEVLLPATGDGAGFGSGNQAETNKVTQRQAVQLLAEQLEEARTARADAVRTEENQRELLLGLAATGLAAERVVHEFGRQVVAVFEALTRLKALTRDESRASEALEALEACLGALRNESRELAPFAGLERAQRSAWVNVEEMARVAFHLNARAMSEGHIVGETLGSDFSIRVRAASLAQVFDNLVNNACVWLASDEANQNRKIEVDLDAKHHRVVVSDNGPGVAEILRGTLFMPMVTGRLGGRGLGLY
ncbi:MAG: ATP-binding protein, partial [Ktedonobacterales bacterium]